MSKSCLSVSGFLCLCAQEEGSVEGSGLPALTHGVQTKQHDECFLNPTWHGGVPIKFIYKAHFKTTTDDQSAAQ